MTSVDLLKLRHIIMTIDTIYFAIGRIIKLLPVLISFLDGGQGHSNKLSFSLFVCEKLVIAF